jgi:vancomycin permeability regulator SanA
VIKRRLKRLTIAGLIVCVLGGLVMIGGEIWVRANSDGHVYSEAAVPAAPVALVLGAQVYADGTPSAYLAARLDLAKRLLATGKVKAILLSGDHRSWDYDEPGSMEVYLLAHGVPARQIVLDYAGFDTYDSCARAKRIFGVRQAIVVTQSFHVGRAVALCRHLGVEATGALPKLQTLMAMDTSSALDNSVGHGQVHKTHLSRGVGGGGRGRHRHPRAGRGTPQRLFWVRQRCARS